MNIGKVTRNNTQRKTRQRVTPQSTKPQQPKVFFSLHDVIKSDDYTPDEVGIDDHLRNFSSQSSPQTNGITDHMRRVGVTEDDWEDNWFDQDYNWLDDTVDVYTRRFMKQNPDLKDYYDKIEADDAPFDSNVYDDWEDDEGWYVPHDQVEDDGLSL